MKRKRSLAPPGTRITHYTKSDAIKDRDIVKLIGQLPFSVNGYKFEEVIGSGSFGVIFKVYHYGYKRYFAAKVLCQCPSKDQPELDSEICILTKLFHPSIIKIYEYFEYQGKLIMILQYCSKGTLKGMINTGIGIPKVHIIPYMKQIIDALSYLHENNIAHLDIKTTNVFIDDQDRPLLGDFGLSKCVDGEIQSYCGSLLYRSPEMIQQLPYDPFKADVWALGVTFYIMVTGSSPFPSFNADIMKKSIVEGNYQIPDTVDPVVAEIIKRMLVVDPSQRPTISEINNLPILARKLAQSNHATFRNKPMKAANRLLFLPSSSAMSLEFLKARIKLSSSSNLLEVPKHIHSSSADDQ